MDSCFRKPADAPIETTICRAVFEKGRRVLVVSDIHGHRRELEDALHRAHFSADDVLVIVGDMVEKGPDSLGALRLIMALCGTHTVYPLMGNVDEFVYRQIMSDDPAQQNALLERAVHFKAWWGNSLLHEMCAPLGIAPEQSSDIAAVLQSVRKAYAKELAFIRALPTVLDTPCMTFVHGGLPAQSLSDLPMDDCRALLKLDAFSEGSLSFSKPVVVGHWPATLYRAAHPDASPYFDRRRNILSIDGGCGIKEDGQLNLLIYRDGGAAVTDYTRVAADSLPKILALENQPASLNPAYIRWIDRVVTLLEKDGEQSTILFHGRKMRVPTACLRFKEGEVWCDDMTDYRLPVNQGDTLKLVYAHSFGCYVKKGDESGWYLGAYQSI